VLAGWHGVLVVPVLQERHLRKFGEIRLEVGKLNARNNSKLMTLYCVVAVQHVPTGGYETTITGPGIPDAGLSYWFDSRDEAYSFVDNLNLSFRESKRLAKWRKSYIRRHLLAARA
jgi:hypothetical protein